MLLGVTPAQRCAEQHLTLLTYFSQDKY